MGEEINSPYFTAEDFLAFKHLLMKETHLLTRWFEDKVFYKGEGLTLGMELEAWLLDRDYLPVPENEAFLRRLSDVNVVPEISKFNIELNAPPQLSGPSCLSRLKENLQSTWNKLQSQCNQMDIQALMIGSVPTLRDNMLSIENMTDFSRYKAMNEQIFRLRKNAPVRLEVSGRDYLRTEHSDIMLEAAATSFQIHILPPFEQLTRYFNASYFAAVPLVAAAANTPYLFGVDLWDETRIAIFEQAVAVPGFFAADGSLQRRVTFGGRFIKTSVMELFLENAADYPILLPQVNAQDPASMYHLRLHNGNIWRWIRPIVGIDDEGKPHVRIEQRVPAAGPTIDDCIANLAFCVGLTHALAQQEVIPEEVVSFEKVRQSFYAAARDGLGALVCWPGYEKIGLQHLIFEVLLPQTRQALNELGFTPGEIGYYLDEVFAERVCSGRTGAAWQRSFVALHGPDFQALTSRYLELQESGLPVCRWEV